MMAPEGMEPRDDIGNCVDAEMAQVQRARGVREHGQDVLAPGGGGGGGGGRVNRGGFGADRGPSLTPFLVESMQVQLVVGIAPPQRRGAGALGRERRGGKVTLQGPRAGLSAAARDGGGGSRAQAGQTAAYVPPADQWHRNHIVVGLGRGGVWVIGGRMLPEILGRDGDSVKVMKAARKSSRELHLGLAGNPGPGRAGRVTLCFPFLGTARLLGQEDRRGAFGPGQQYLWAPALKAIQPRAEMSLAIQATRIAVKRISRLP